jgi:hypothetical protein
MIILKLFAGFLILIALVLGGLYILRSLYQQVAIICLLMAPSYWLTFLVIKLLDADDTAEVKEYRAYESYCFYMNMPVLTISQRRT